MRMSVVVINRLRFSVPVGDVAPDVQREFPPAFAACEGLERFDLVQVADDEAFSLIYRDSAEHAKAGADQIGPTVFIAVVAPSLWEQDRRVGPAVATHVAP
jgi:hypothetical protein